MNSTYLLQSFPFIGLINGNIIYPDGTVVKGYCNNFKKLYADQLYYLRDLILKYRHETDEEDLWFKMDKYFNNNEFKDEIGLILKKKVLLKIKHMEENVNVNQPISIIGPEDIAYSIKRRNEDLIIIFKLRQMINTE